MAKQKSQMNMEGKVGNFTYYKTRDGYAVRKSEGGVTADRVKNDPRYARTRENGREFGRAGRASKLIRDGLRPVLLMIADGRMTSRFTAACLTMVQSDPVSARGDRTATHGNPEVMVGFEFNGKAALGQTLLVEVAASIDRAAGGGRVTVAPFVPQSMLKAVPGSSHFQFLAGILAVNFDNETRVQATHFSAPQPLVNTEVPETVVDISLPAGFDQDHIFLVFGVRFLQIVNGREYPLNDISHNVLTLIAASAGVPVPAAA